MTRNKSFWRKVMYLCGIAALLIPLALISAPATTADTGGGVLTQMRRDERLSQSQLGKVDPASASMTLATLGMRGIAANRLWAQSEKYKRTENWDAFKATLNQISKLQPNFVSVWQYQSWNISYNVSVEFDNYKHRYHWVKKGVDYLIEGNEYNRNDPMLLWDTGWFFGQNWVEPTSIVSSGNCFETIRISTESCRLILTSRTIRAPTGNLTTGKRLMCFSREAKLPSIVEPA